jgi:tRNA/tmRNA/rRNA uracil-C5-methylase (TrmA/RlmC/RlmD family)
MTLHRWANKLLMLRNSTKSRAEKLQDIIQLTNDAKKLIPLIKKIFMELKKTGWDESSWKSKFKLLVLRRAHICL